MSNKFIIIPTMFSGNSSIPSVYTGSSLEYLVVNSVASSKNTGFSSQYDFTPGGMSMMGTYGPYSLAPESHKDIFQASSYSSSIFDLDYYTNEKLADITSKASLALSAWTIPAFNVIGEKYTYIENRNFSNYFDKFVTAESKVIQLPGAKTLLKGFGLPAAIGFSGAAVYFTPEENRIEEIKIQTVVIGATVVTGAAALALFAVPTSAVAITVSGIVGLSAGLKTESIIRKSEVFHKDPLILDLSGNTKIDLVGLYESHALFDMDADGLLNRTAWVSNSDGLLVLDKNNDGIINDLSEVFSEHFDARATSALAALKLFDTNYDNKITAADARFGDLRVWVDANSDGITDAGELKTLTSLGITQIDLNAATVDIEDEHGNITQAITSATRSGQNIKAEEVALLVNTTDFALDKTENGINYYKGADGSILGVAADAAGKTVDLATSKIDAFIGNAGNDILSTSGKDSVAMDGGAGNDVITGGDGDDILVGGDGADSLSGGKGDDTLFIDSADTTVDGGEGNDTVFITTNTGMSFNAADHRVETVFGGDGADTITTSGTESLLAFGGAGNDNISGADGNDSLDGGEGNDTITGGAGMDTAIYSGKKSDYTVTNTGSTWTVQDNRAAVDGVVNNGTDTLTGVERIRFEDDVVHTDNTNNNPIVVGGKMAVRNLDSLTITNAELLGTATDKDGDYLTVVGIAANDNYFCELGRVA